MKAFVKSQTELHNHVSEKIETIRNDATEIALYSSIKLAGDLLSATPQLPLEQLLKSIFDQVRNMSQVRIAVPESVVDTCQSAIQKIAEQAGFAGQIVVTGDPKLVWIT